MKVLLVDDNENFLVGLVNLLEASDIEVVGTAHTAEKAIALTRILHPDVVLMDVMMPGRGGIEATRVLRQLFPSVKIVMMTVSERDQHLYEAIDAGAIGYLQKGVSMDELPTALVELTEGEAPMSPGLMGKVLAEFARRSQPLEVAPKLPGRALTLREVNILRRASQGMTYKQIAEQMGLSERTIKYNFREIAEKMQVENRAQVLAQARRFLATSVSGETSAKYFD